MAVLGGILFINTLAPVHAQETRAAPPQPQPQPGALAKKEAPPEYRSAALPLESADLEAAFRRAEEYLQAQEWARGLAALDEVLAQATLPAGKARPRAPVARPKVEAPPPLAPGRRGGLRGAPAPQRDEPEVDPRESLLSRDAILYHPAARVVRERLLELPKEARELYRRTYEAPARAAMEKALELPAERALAELRRVGERYPLTPQGATAWRSLAHRLQGAGRHFEAARAFDTAATLQGAMDSSPRAQLLTSAAAAYLRSGSLPSGEARLQDLARTFGDAVIPVRGEAFSGRDLRQESFFSAELARLLAPPPGPFVWTTGQGTFDNSCLRGPIDLLSQVGSLAKWIHRLAPDPPPGSNRRYNASSAPVGGAALGDLLYLRRSSDLLAVHAATGKIAWSVDPTELLARRSGPQDTGQFAVGNMDNATTAITILRGSEADGRALVLVVPAAVTGANNEAGQPTFEPNIIAAYDATNGKLVWVFGRTRSEWDPVQGLAFTAPPTLAGNLLVAPAVRGESVFGVGLTTRGKVRWVRRLYTFPTGQETPFGGLAIPGLSFAAADGVAVLALGQGLACALDAESGSVLWVTRYRSRSRAAGAQQFLAGSHLLPVLSGQRVLLRPSDTDILTALDLHSGKLAWEHPFEPRELPGVLGADGERAFTGAERMRAFRLADGKELWTSPRVAGMKDPRAKAAGGDAAAPPDGEDEEAQAAAEDNADIPFGSLASHNAQVAAAVFTSSSILTATSDGLLAVFDTATGKALRRVRVVDPRLGSREPFRLFLAAGAVLAIGSNKLYRLEPQSASWETAGDDPNRWLGQRARLLRAEGRFEEALKAYEALLATLGTPRLVEAVERDIIATTRQAALAANNPELLSNLLSRSPAIVKERSDVLAFRLLEAALLEQRGDLAGAVSVYLPLALLDGVVDRAGDVLEVDVGAHAADSLRELAGKGATVDDGVGEERARTLLERGRKDETRPSSFLLLRRSHLAIAREAGRRLLGLAEASGDAMQALALLEIAAREQGDFDANADLARRRLELRASREREPITPGLTRALAPVLEKAGGRLTQAFGVTQEEGFLAASSRRSEPLPLLVAVSGTNLRLYGPDGAVVAQRQLPDYPDIAQIKLSMEASAEEPAHVCFRDGTLVLSTAAGLHAFRGLKAPDRTTFRARDLTTVWSHPCSHPLAESNSNSRGGWWGGLRLPANVVFFPEVSFEREFPVVLLRSGAFYAVDPRSGKLVHRSSVEHGPPAAGPEVSGKDWLVRTGTPAGIEVIQPERARKAARRPHQWIQGPTSGTSDAKLVAGGLVAIFQTNQGVDVIEAASGRSLWRTVSGGALLAFVDANEVWLVESQERLVARALRSGREQRSLRIAAGSVLLTAFPELAPTGEIAAWTLALSQNAVRGRNSYYYHGRDQTGTHLSLLQVTPAGEKRWEKRLIDGAMTYSGERHLLDDGSFLLLLNRQTSEEKWYTQAVLVDPSGNAREVLSSEIHGKGTGLEPRLQVLEDGLAVGNTDGFGWFSARPAPAAAEAPTGSTDNKEPE